MPLKRKNKTRAVWLKKGGTEPIVDSAQEVDKISICRKNYFDLFELVHKQITDKKKEIIELENILTILLCDGTGVELNGLNIKVLCEQKSYLLQEVNKIDVKLKKIHKTT